MKVFFIAVFDNENKSTNNSQAKGFEKSGSIVARYSFREKLSFFNDSQDLLKKDLINELSNFNPDLVVFSKCFEIKKETIKLICEKYRTCYWYMDPLVNNDILIKSSYCNFTTIAWEKNLKDFLKYNKNTFIVQEGFDSETESPYEIDKEFDVSFIGTLHSNRINMLVNLNPPIVNIQNAYSNYHSIAVGKSKININISTDGAASDRVFKVLAAKGFLLTTDWIGRDKIFKDGKDLVIFKDKNDLQEKITFYLENEYIRNSISQTGYNTVQEFNRNEWAKKLIAIYKNIFEINSEGENK